jgi:uncharacterized lipoprotein YddW (UPF0748 family)
MLRAALLSCALALSMVAASAAGPAAPVEVRALWVVRTSLVSRASIAEMVTAAKTAGFNALVVQVRGRGDAYYRSRLEPRAQALAGQPEAFDPLATAIELGHAAGLRVHAWVNINLVADPADVPVSRRHVIFRHPEWLMVPAELARASANPRDRNFINRLLAWTRAQSATVEGLYTSPLADDNVSYVTEIVADLAARYAVDGVHFDYARFPGPGFDYSRDAVKAFRKVLLPTVSRKMRTSVDAAARTNPLAWPEHFPEAWRDFRRHRLTYLVRRLRIAVRERRPAAVVSAAVVPDPDVATATRFQDWPAWLAQDLLDVVCPMIYTTDRATFRTQVERARLLARGHGLWAGVGAYRLDLPQTVQHIGLARAAGADGVIVFSYDAATSGPRGPETLVRLGQQAFGQ